MNNRGYTNAELVNSFDWQVGCGGKKFVQLTQDTAKWQCLTFCQSVWQIAAGPRQQSSVGIMTIFYCFTTLHKLWIRVEGKGNRA
jgi:hypothetical protein